MCDERGMLIRDFRFSYFDLEEGRRLPTISCHSSVIRDWDIISVGVERLECLRQISFWSTIWPGSRAILENHFWSGKGTKCSSQEDSVNWTFGFLFTVVLKIVKSKYRIGVFISSACWLYKPSMSEESLCTVMTLKFKPQVELQPSRTLNLNQGDKSVAMTVNWLEERNILMQSFIFSDAFKCHKSFSNPKEIKTLT